MAAADSHPMVTRWQRCLRALTGRHVVWIAAGLACLLTLPSLRVGLIVDDYHHKLVMQGIHSPASILSSRFDLFRLLGDREQVQRLMDFGMLPWWTSPEIHASFWRPISSLTHWLDYRLWPQTPALMHAQSILWYAALAAIVAVFYRRFAGAGLVAGLASILYAIDDAHATPVGFLANRNAVIAALFGVLALLAHDAWRRGGKRAGAVAAPTLLAMSLLAKEEGIATCAYLAAYALFLDCASRRHRLLSLVPYAAVVIVWRGFWSYLGYGVENVGHYVDPLHEPLRYLGALAQHGWSLLLAQLATPPADLLMFLSSSARFVWIIVTCALSLGILALLWKQLRSERLARFWLTGMLLCILPICTTFPSERMLLFAGIGAMGLIAQFLVSVFGQARCIRSRSCVLLAGVFIVLHAVIAPVVLALRSAVPIGPQAVFDRLSLREPLDTAVTEQDLIIVNAPAAFFLMEGALIWAADGAPMPRHMRLLGSGVGLGCELHRVDERTLIIRAARGLMESPLDQLWRDQRHPLRVGDRVKVPGLEVEVLALSGSGWPGAASFQFNVPLEDASLRWMQWRGGAYVPFIPPQPGNSVTLTTSWRDILP